MTPLERELEGKTVTGDPDTLALLLPSFHPITETAAYPYTPKALYIGKNVPNLKRRLEQNHESYIWVRTSGEVDLQTNSALLTAALKNHDKTPTEKQKETIDTLEPQDAKPAIQRALLTGKVTLPEQLESSTWKLFESIPGPQTEMIRTLLRTLESTPPPQVEASLLTMLLRVRDVKDQEVKPVYKKLLEQTNMKIGRNIQKAVRAYAQENKRIKELALVELLLELRGR